MRIALIRGKTSVQFRLTSRGGPESGNKRTAWVLLNQPGMHPFPHHYTVSSEAFPEGEIVLESPGIPRLATVTPPEFDGPGGLWSPETLMVAAVADCFLLTFRGIARASKMPWTSVSVSCDGTLERPDRITQFTRFDLRARLTLPADVDDAQARRILTKAEETCLITRSLKAVTHLEIEIER